MTGFIHCEPAYVLTKRVKGPSDSILFESEF